MIDKKENLDKIIEEVSSEIVNGNSLEAASIIVEASIDEVEPTTADELNEEYIEEINDIEKELEKNLDTLGRTVQQLMTKMDDINQNTVNLKHRIQVLETRVGVIH